MVTITEPGDVQATFENITAFDDREFGFNHNPTWGILPKALQGKLDPDRVDKSLSQSKMPTRIRRCIVGLLRFGKRQPRSTMSFADFPGSGLKTVQSIDWDPEVRVRVKATCWYVRGTTTVIPVLQPRKDSLDPERLAVYVALVRQAYCQGDWVDAEIELIDLSGEGDEVRATIIDIASLPRVTDKRIAEYVQTYLAAKKLADEKRAEKPKTPAEVPMADLLGLDALDRP